MDWSLSKCVLARCEWLRLRCLRVYLSNRTWNAQNRIHFQLLVKSEKCHILQIPVLLGRMVEHAKTVPIEMMIPIRKRYYRQTLNLAMRSIIYWSWFIEMKRFIQKEMRTIFYEADRRLKRTCCWDCCCNEATDGFVSKCWRWCSIKWFFWKNALPHSQTCVRNVQLPLGWRRLCCNRPCLAANPLPQLVQKCVFGFCCGAVTTTFCCALWCWTTWWCCWWCCCWWCGLWTIGWTTWPPEIICTGTGVCCTTDWLDVSTVVPGFIDDVLRKWPGNAAVNAHKSVINDLSPVWRRKWSANASRLLNAWPHSLQKERGSKQTCISLGDRIECERQLIWREAYLHAYWGLGDVSGDVIVVTKPLFDWLTTVTVCGWCWNLNIENKRSISRSMGPITNNIQIDGNNHSSPIAVVVIRTQQ